MNKKKIWILTGSIILFFLMSMYVSYNNIWSRVFSSPWAIATREDSNNYLGNTRTWKMQDGDILEQKIPMVSKNFTGFAVKFYEQSQEDGKVQIVVLDKNDNIVEQWFLNSKELNEKEYYDLYFETLQKVKVGDNYTVKIIPQLETGDYISIEMTQPTTLTGKAALNGKLEDLSIAYKLYDGTVSALKYLFIAFILAGVVSTVVLAVILQSKTERKIMLSFIVLAFFIGSMYIFALPPFSIPDEATHIKTVYAASNKLLGKEVLDSNGCVIADADLGICYTSEEYPTKSTYVEYFKGALGRTDNVVNGTINIGKPLALTKWIGYFPQILGVSLARIIGLNGEQLLILGRMFALLWYCLIMGIAINIAPFKKIVFFVVGLMPMTIQQISSFSYDSVLIGCCFLLFAYLLNLIFQKDELSWKDALVIAILTIIIGKVKYIYLPILGLVFFIPKEKFSKYKKNKVIARGVFALLVGVGISRTTMLVQAAEVGKLRADGLYQYTVKYVIQNIGDTIIVAIRTILNQTSFYIESMIASPLGWVDIELPEIIVFCFIIILLLSGLSDRKKYVFSKTEKRVCCLIAILISGLVLAAMLVAYTYIGSDIILGVQGRYFIPILPLMLYAMDSDFIVLKRNIDVEIIFAVHGLQLYAIWAITSTIVSR